MSIELMIGVLMMVAVLLFFLIDILLEEEQMRIRFRSIRRRFLYKSETNEKETDDRGSPCGYYVYQLSGVVHEISPRIRGPPPFGGPLRTCPSIAFVLRWMGNLHLDGRLAFVFIFANLFSFL